MSNFYTEPFVSAGEMEFPSEPYITAQPQNHTASGPEEYVLTVIAAGAVSYRWEVYDGERWSAISGATSDTLTINIDSSMNGWRYRVLVTGADGSTVVSKAAQIAVKGFHEYTLGGAIVTFMGPVTIIDLKANIVAVQDLHGYENPWPAGGGKNKFNPDFTNTTISGTTITKLPDGKVTTSGVPTASFDFVLGHFTLSAGTYILNGAPADGGVNKWRLQVTDYPVVNSLGQDNGSGVTFTLSSDMEIAVRLQMYVGASSPMTFAPMIRLSSVTDSTFAPYENICPISGFSEVDVVVSPTLDAGDGTTYPISLDSTYYGGVLDVTSGVLTVTHGCSPISADWGWSKSSSYPGGFYFNAQSYLGYKPYNPIISSHAKTATTLSEYVKGTCYCDSTINFRLMTAESTVQDWEDFITAQANANTPITICYELATPTTVQLTPTEVSTLLGQNNIWANSGDISVTILR